MKTIPDHATAYEKYDPAMNFSVEIKGEINDVLEAFGSLVELWKGHLNPPMLKDATDDELERLAELLTTAGAMMRVGNLSKVHMQS